jgi:hypothetical protein
MPTKAVNFSIRCALENRHLFLSYLQVTNLG